MKIFITGATGFIGTRFVEMLGEHAASDICVYLLTRKVFSMEDSRFHVLEGSLENIKEYANVLQSCTHVFHFGGIATFGNDLDYKGVNLRPTKDLVDLLQQSLHLKNFVFTSTVGAYDRAPNDHCRSPITNSSIPYPRSQYGQSKLEAENYIKQSKLPSTIMRPTWVYGAGMRFNSHINAFATMVSDGSFFTRVRFPGRVSLVHVDDLCRALLLCIENESLIGKTYFVASENKAIGEILAIIHQKVHGQKPIQVPFPRMAWLWGRIHSHVPLTLSNLFLDYLVAEKEPFLRCFKIHKPLFFKDRVGDVLSDNSRISGHWIITGANSGIGLELAKSLDAENKKLILVDRKIDSLHGFSKHTIIKADLCNDDDLAKMVTVVEKYKIGYLINNAGVGFKGTVEELTEKQIKKITWINSVVPMILTKRLLHRLKKDGSVIVNVGSSIAYNPLPGMSIYSATKAALVNWSESLSYELKDTNKVVTVSPSGTLTNFQKTAGVKVLRGGKGLLTPQYVAKRLLKAAKGDKKVVVVGFFSIVLLFCCRFSPRSFNIKLWGKMYEKFR